MSEFFQSEMVREELQEINELQKEVFGDMMNFNAMPDEEKMEHVEKLSSLLEKQKIMYTRLSLCDDPAAKEMKQNLEKSIRSLIMFVISLNCTYFFTRITHQVLNS